MVEKRIFLGERSFSLNDQDKFALFSGDNNPIHLDNIEARKRIPGECIVHGINSFLWSLELFFSKENHIHSFYKVTFKKKISLNQNVRCFCNKNNNQIIIENRSKDELVLIEYRGHLKNKFRKDNFASNKYQELSFPIKTNNDDLLNYQFKDSIFGGRIEYGYELFPKLFAKFYGNLIHEISTLSNIVGMQLPGFNSLFHSFEINLEKTNDIKPRFQLLNYKEKLRLLNIHYIGKNFVAYIKALNPPKSYSSEINSNIKNRINSYNIYLNKKVLIIGGSRGIGSFVAKVIALLGAEVTITYVIGSKEAKLICDDINKNTSESKCNYVSFNIKTDNYEDIFNVKYDFLFYFATPKIFGENVKIFDNQKYLNFKDFYCIKFEEIAKSFIINGGKKIFYPSSVALEDEIVGLEEYKLAKLKGEKICKKLIKKFNIDLVVERLARIDTDQTLTILSVPALNPYDVAIDIVMKMINK